ncbi:response regulator [Desulfopila sp. IMCC35008]|uniref:response regulator n=1 Tax=Desulfopila sp. IMCC35008 TaxID=2653858 RepID=UPI0013D64446|nr:response regulator [Desulfopila sp. IMCC35008]
MTLQSLGIRTKLIIIFILIKVLPLVALAWYAWEQIANLTVSVEKQSSQMIVNTHEVVSGVSKLSTENSIRALDEKSREAIERLTTDTAKQVADFLYDRDLDILLASKLEVDGSKYREFLESRFRPVILHHPWVMNENGEQWISSSKDISGDEPAITATNKDNSKDFHYRAPDRDSILQNRPLYLEMTFIDLSGNEIIKAGTSATLPSAKQNVADPANTYCRSETYFEALQKLSPGEIYVSEVIGPYIEGHMIGTYSKIRAKEKGIEFKPELSGYAGKENPVGRRFQGLVRWGTPVVEGDRIVGYVTLALDHTHIMEFTDHLVPTAERYSAISDAGSGNYGFMWDNKGRNISHPRDYFIVGYDPATGGQAVPWLDEEMYDLWQETGMSMTEFETQAPTFKEQSLDKKPASSLTQAGMLGLDCRYLNFAPQCTGWLNLTQKGGSGSFLIFWSGLWKLTTAAAIPYHTGLYRHSPVGFGFVTIGANVDEFHHSAMETAEIIRDIESDFAHKLEQEKTDHITQLHQTLQKTFHNLSIYTLMMIAAVIFIAVIMAGVLTSRIISIVSGIRRFQQGERSHRLEMQSNDEMGQLARAYNEMADTVQAYISDVEKSKTELENVNKDLEGEIGRRQKIQEELSQHRDNLEETVKNRTQDLEKEIVERKRIQTLQQEIEERLRNQNNSLLHLAGNQSLYSGNLETSFDTIVSLASKTLHADRCGVWLLNEEGLSCTCRMLVIDGKSVAPDKQPFLMADYPRFMTTLINSKTIVARDVNSDEWLTELVSQNYLSSRNIQSLLIAGIKEHGEFAGWVSFSQISSERKWHLDEINFAASIADIIGLAIGTANQKKAVEEKEELTSRLRRAEKMEALGTLAGGVAHDLNNILSGIVTYPELLLMQLPKESKLREPIHTILSSGKRAAAVVQDLLTMARRGVATMNVVNLNHVVEDYFNSPEYHELASHHTHVTIDRRLEPGLLNILGSPVHLSKTLMNLVANGLEAIPSAGRVTISTENCYIDRPVKGYDVVNEGDYVSLTVKDTGLGISPDDFNRIFEPFYTKKKMGRSGTGLGMAVVWGTVKDHQGYIDFESHENKGSRFTLYFPVTRKISDDSKAQKLETYLGNGESILVVDDVEEQREIASAILTALGYRVDSVESGEAAIKYLHNNKVDLMILDMIMDPGIDGLDTYKEVINHWPDQKVIITSGFSETDRTREVLHLGASVYLKKPYTIEKFGTSVDAVLHSKE